MRVLFDQGTPVPLRNYLGEHKVATAAEMDWSKLSNDYTTLHLMIRLTIDQHYSA